MIIHRAPVCPHMLYKLCEAELLVLMQVELKTNPDTPDSGSVQKAADFVQAFILGACLSISLLPYSFLAAMHIKSC